MLEAPIADPWTADLAVKLLGTSPLAAVILAVGIPLNRRLRELEATGERLDKAVEHLSDVFGSKLRRLGRRARKADKRSKVNAEALGEHADAIGEHAEAIGDLQRTLEVQPRRGAGRGRRRGPSPARSTTRGRIDAG